MEGSVLSLLKAEWKVSDTGSVGGSAYWASSFKWNDDDEVCFALYQHA
jgi:hypothetical protein